MEDVKRTEEEKKRRREERERCGSSQLEAGRQ